MMNDKIKIFLVDDDAVYLKLLAIEFLHHADFTIETFATEIGRASCRERV